MLSMSQGQRRSFVRRSSFESDYMGVTLTFRGVAQAEPLSTPSPIASPATDSQGPTLITIDDEYTAPKVGLFVRCALHVVLPVRTMNS